MSELITTTSELTTVADSIRIMRHNSSALSFPQGFLNALSKPNFSDITDIADIIKGLGALGSPYNLYSPCNTIKAYCFVGWYGIRTIDLPLCETIEEAAFSGATYLSEISLPLCKTIKYHAFDNAGISDINLPNCLSIEGYAFYANGDHLSQINLPVCTYIGPYAFGYCTSLESVELPECITVGSYAFMRCYSLHTVKFPKCQIIESGAFAQCSSLQSLYLPGSSYVSITGNIVGNTYLIESGYVYVPSSMIDTYKTMSYWSDISSRFSAI